MSILDVRKWEGRVLEILDGVLTVEFTPLDHEGAELLAEFDADLLGCDSDFVVPGDLVHLTVEPARDRAHDPRRTASLELRKPGVWTEQDLREIDEAAKKQARFWQDAMATVE